MTHESYIQKLNQIKEELNIKSNQITKVLTELVNKLQPHIPPIEVVDDIELIIKCWMDGSMSRCKWCKWAITRQFDEFRLVLRCNADYTGARDWEEEPAQVIEKLKKEKRYKVIHALARRLIEFLDIVIDSAEKQASEIDETLTKLKVVINVLNKR
ncbi:MAG: hypothetical protein DRP08_01470 [Candidatus Aenigmatarchaeota archaeon]|nr:MAG: hypothetical protein DRP08_01470 [Candidatus Aenigmarchaeota archaeon]